MILSSIPLTLRPTEPGKYVPELTVDVDGNQKIFMLDTGAASSSIAIDEHVVSYPSLGAAESKGASGKIKECDYVQPEKMRLGEHVFAKTRITRCDGSLLGLDRLKEFVFQIDLKGKRINLLKGLSNTAKIYPIRRLSPGHITISAKLGDDLVDALFDTGADTTVIDTMYVKKHIDKFKLLRSEEGTDAHGNKIPSNIYQCSSVQLGDLVLKDVEMAAFDFGDYLRGKMEGSPIMLGINVISNASWSFDLNNNRWTSQPY